MRHFNRARDLKNMLYMTPPLERLGMMKYILDHCDRDAELRNILTNPDLLKARLCKFGRVSISQAASAYTKKFYDVSITTFLRQLRAGTLDENHPVMRGMPQWPAPPLPGVDR